VGPQRPPRPIKAVQQPKQKQLPRSRIHLPPLQPYRRILNAAKGFRDRGDYDVAVILAQTACEVLAEQTFEKLFRDDGTSAADRKLLEPKAKNLAAPRTRALYTLLSKDRIQQQPFWQDYRDHANLRHKIVHAGASATKQEADKSLRVADRLINHVRSVVP
jgi:HEPN domain-containing protein